MTLRAFKTLVFVLEFSLLPFSFMFSCHIYLYSRPSPTSLSRFPCFSCNSLMLRIDLTSFMESVCLPYMSASIKFLYDLGRELTNNNAFPSSSKASSIVASVSYT